MNKLKDLLDAKWPITIVNPPSGSQTALKLKEIESHRKDFSEGYEAAREECKKVVQEMLDGPFDGWQYDDPLIARGYNLALQDAKATLHTV